MEKGGAGRAGTLRQRRSGDNLRATIAEEEKGEPALSPTAKADADADAKEEKEIQEALLEITANDSKDSPEAQLGVRGRRRRRGGSDS